MEFRTVVGARRMVRSFTGRPVDPGLLGRVLDAALRTPAAGNADGWAGVVLTGSDTAAFWAATTTEDWRGASRRWSGLARAPVVVVVVADPGAYVARYREPDKAASGLGTSPEAWPVPYWFVDAGMAAHALLLGAVDAGLGGCFLGNFRGEPALLEVLGVPAGWRYAGAVLLGEAAEDDPPSASARRPRPGADTRYHTGRW